MRTSGAPSKRVASRRTRLVLVAFGLSVTLVTGEIAARVIVALRWTDEKLRVYTHECAEKGSYAGHPRLPYVLRPSYEETHFRNPDHRFASGNAGHKIAFRISHLFMLLCTSRGSRFA